MAPNTVIDEDAGNDPNNPSISPAHLKTILEMSAAFAKYVFVAVLPVIGWLVGNTLEMREWRAVVSSNRFTNESAQHLRAELSRDISVLATRLNQIDNILASLPTEHPPQWVLDRVSKVEASYELLLDRLNSQNDLLIRIDQKVANMVTKTEK